MVVCLQEDFADFSAQSFQLAFVSERRARRFKLSAEAGTERNF